MIAALRLSLLLLVLLNLGFVQLTGAVGAPWLLGLWLAAAAAPFLVPWHDRLLYRGLWNGTVLVAFAFLVNDAMTSGLLHMLEDGLLLAALCQVHLLNNVGQRQRPDLLFFNSFLIAFVTSFFCGDVAWSICFCLYAAVLVPALQLYTALPRQGALDPATARRLLRDGLPRSAAALVLTAVVFVAFPRDFHRDGWLGDALQLGGQPMVAFAEEVRLDRTTTPTLSDSEVLRLSSADAELPSHWRGVTFVEFDGAGWQPYRVLDFGTRGATDPAWQAVARTRWQRPFLPRGAPIRVRLLDQSGRRLFLPIDACEFALADGAVPVLVDPKADAVIALDEYVHTDGELVVTLRVGRAPPPPLLSPRARTLLLRTPQRLPRALTQLATTLRAQLPADALPTVVAEHARDWLAQNRRYALPGTPGAARTLDDFLLGTGGGHCEYFATTLALLLRLQGLPCRVAGGYLAHERDEATGEIVVRQRDAHAWVELHSADSGWVVLDATPADSGRAAATGRTWWQQAVAAVQAGWSRVAAFGSDDRRALYAWLLALPGDALAAAGRHPLAAIAGLSLLVVFVRLRRRRNAPPRAIAELQRVLRRAHLTALAGETPRELLARAQAGSPPLPPATVTALAAAIAAHEAARYADAGQRHPT